MSSDAPFSHEKDSSPNAPVLRPPAPDGPGNRPPRATRIVAGVTAICLAIGAILAASVVSFLTTCSLNPMNALNEAGAGPRAQAYWQQKYGETREVSETDYPRYPTSIPWPNVDTDQVVVNLGEKDSYDSLVLIDLKTGEISDNHQSAEVRRALDSYVRDGLAGFEGTGLVASVAFDEGADADEGETGTDAGAADAGEGATGTTAGGGADTADPNAGLISFNTPQAASSAAIFPDEAPASSRMFFSARFDGDAEAFVQAERQQGHLDMEAPSIVVGLDVARELQTDVPQDGSASWRGDVDPVRQWLNDRFDAYPQLVVLAEKDAEQGWLDSTFRLGVYPGGHGSTSPSPLFELPVIGDQLRTGASLPRPPLVDSWVTFGEQSQIHVESDMAGVILTEDGVQARRLDAEAIDLDALMGDSDWTLTDVRDVYAVTLTGESLAQARAAMAEQDSDLATVSLRMSLGVPGFAYDYAGGQTGSDGTYGTAEYERNYYAYVMEVASVDDTGNVSRADDQFADADQLRPEVSASGGAWSEVLRDPEDTLLVVVARKARS